MQAVMTSSVPGFRRTTSESLRQRYIPPFPEDQVQNSTIREGSSRPIATYQGASQLVTSRSTQLDEPKCVCRCYQWMYRVIQVIPENVFGRVMISARSLPIVSRSCNHPSCKCSMTPSIHIQYHLPIWLATKMAIHAAIGSPPYTPESVIPVPRLVKSDSIGFNAVKDENVDILRSAMASRECTPYYVDEKGRSLIEVLIRTHDHLAYTYVRILTRNIELFANESGRIEDVGKIIWLQWSF